jgi:two-component system sensor histidine kinase KdpD
MRSTDSLHGWGRGIRSLIVGIALPVAATLLAALPIDVSTTTAALAYVLAVTAAAVVGGLISGLAASLLSFLALNFFFTPPFHTFVVTKAEDLIALVVFLLVSATVGALISTALAQRARAERREHEVREAREEAETNRARAALFSSVTHDLRTPLASITAAVTTLLADDGSVAPDDRRELLDTIHHEAERLNRVVGNLLDLSRMRAGALVPAKKPAAVDEVIEGVLARLEPMLRNHELRVDLPDDLPDVPIDVVQIDQVLTNVLENAARFTPPGRHIDVSARAPDAVVRVRIADEGRGLGLSEREHVFEPFVHAEDSSGTGLGLSIARAIVEAHGGAIWFEDGLGPGAAVVFELPRSA